MAVEFEITVDNSTEVIKQVAERCEAALEACGIQAVSHAQQNVNAAVPRHAGSWYTSQGEAGLRGSISYQVQGDTCYVGTNNEYAIYNEVGTGIYVEGGGGRQSPWKYQDDKGNWHRTRGITPIHFLKNALAKHVKEYKEIIKQYLNK